MPSIKSVGTVTETVKRKGEERELSINVDSLAQHPEALAFVVRRFIDRGLQNDLEDRQTTLDNLAEGILPSAGGGGSRISYRVQAAREILQSFYTAKAGYRKADIPESRILSDESGEDSAIRAMLAALHSAKYGTEPSESEVDSLMADNADAVRQMIHEREQALREADQKTSSVTI